MPLPVSPLLNPRDLELLTSKSTVVQVLLISEQTLAKRTRPITELIAVRFNSRPSSGKMDNTFLDYSKQ